MPYADLHVGKVRFFAMPILSDIRGTDRPKWPADSTGTDMLQATPKVNPGASLSAFDRGRSIRDSGPARTIKMAGAQTTFRF